MWIVDLVVLAFAALFAFPWLQTFLQGLLPAAA